MAGRPGGQRRAHLASRFHRPAFAMAWKSAGHIAAPAAGRGQRLSLAVGEIGQRPRPIPARSSGHSGIRGRERSCRPFPADNRREGWLAGSRGSSCAWRSWSNGRAGRAFRGGLPSASSSAFAQHHEAAALAMDRLRRSELPHAGAKIRGRGERPRMQFGIAAGQPADVAILAPAPRRPAARTARSRRPPRARSAPHAGRGR